MDKPIPEAVAAQQQQDHEREYLRRVALDYAREIEDEDARAAQQQGQAVAWRPMETAPRDGTMIRLLVDFDDHATEDTTDPAPTIGANSFDGTGEDVWQFAGWCWSHDHFTEGKGTPVGWLPMLDGAQPLQQGGGECSQLCMREMSCTGDCAPPSAPVGVEGLQRWSMARGSDGARWSVYMDHDDNGDWVKWAHVQQASLGTALAQQPAAVGGVDWRAMYRVQTAMRYMDNNPAIDAETAYRWADREIRDLATQQQEPTT